jgi:hypothetical protein
MSDPLSHVASWLTSPVADGAVDSLAVAPVEVVDPVIALIAEEERIRCAAIKLDDAADTLRWALPEARQRELKDMEEKSFPGEMGRLYRQSEQLYEEANKLLDRIRETKPIITFAGAIALIENDDNPDAFNNALGFLRDMQITAQPDDSRILSLFSEWVAAQRAADVLCGEDGKSAEYKASAEAVEKIESALIEIPSNGAAGLAIKSYLALRAEGGDFDDGAALGHFALNWEVDAAILKDAVRFVPELAPLAAKALAAALDAVDEAVIGEGDEPEASAKGRREVN